MTKHRLIGWLSQVCAVVQCHSLAAQHSNHLASGFAEWLSNLSSSLFGHVRVLPNTNIEPIDYLLSKYAPASVTNLGINADFSSPEVT
jgi:hypothetical protein